MSWKHWIMMVYGKIKKIPDENQRFDWTKLIRGYRLVNTRWLADINLFNLMIWLNPLEQKHRGRIWLIRTQALQILWTSVHILTHALNNFCRPYGRQLNSIRLRLSMSKKIWVFSLSFLLQHPQKLAIVLLLINNRIHKLEAIFKTLPHSRSAWTLYQIDWLSTEY